MREPSLLFEKLRFFLIVARMDSFVSFLGLLNSPANRARKLDGFENVTYREEIQEEKSKRW
jgi:hypothetical protein